MTLSTRVSRRPGALVSDKLLRPRALRLTLERMTEAVFCHDCRSVVDVDPGAFARAPAIAPACPRCAGVFLEVFDAGQDVGQEPWRALARTIHALLDPSMHAGQWLFGQDIDFTQLDTRNFDAPAAEGTLEALPECECARDGDATCSVCLTDFARGDKAKVLRCEHKFHAPCLGEWLKLVRVVW